MKPGKILALGLLTAMMAACTSSTEESTGTVDGRTLAPTINALTKATAAATGMEMSRAGDEDLKFNPFDEKFVKSMEEVGICPNFAKLIEEFASVSENDTSFDLMTAPTFVAVIECMVGEFQSWSAAAKAPTEAQVMSLLDNCLCAGSGTVFGAIAAYEWTAKYKAPNLSTYKAPSLQGYKAPSLQGYKAPSLKGYKAPAL